MQNQAIESQQVLVNLPPKTALPIAKPHRTIIKRLGSTNFTIKVFFDPNAKETMDKKMLRLIKNEIASRA